MVDNKHLFIRNFRYEKTGPGREEMIMDASKFAFMFRITVP